LGSIDTPRLYRKASGTYFIRILLQAPAPLSSSDATGRNNRVEVRQSLRTKNPDLARSIACWINAILAQCTCLAARADLWSELSLQIKKWEMNRPGFRGGLLA
jgi:hypothetical protein